jgi:uncharacterized membrane protein YfcA
MPTGFLALRQYKKEGFLYLKGSAFIALGIFCGSFFGAKFAIETAGPILKQLFGIFQIIIGIKYTKVLSNFSNFKNKNLQNIDNSSFSNTNHTINQNNELEKPKYINKIIYFATGIGAGLLGGMFGIGGGVIITTILISIYKLNSKQAIAMSLAAMFLPVGIGGVSIYHSNNHVNILAAVIMAIGVEIGSAISAKFAISMQADLLKKLFGVLIILIGIYFLIYPYIFK